MNDWVEIVSLSHFCSPCVDLMTELGEELREGGRGDESEIMGVCTDRMDAIQWMAAGKSALARSLARLFVK